MRVTRLAPSPTGALHLGNARTFLANWLLARKNGWRIILRIEDLDGPRVNRGADQQAIDDLRWLGLDWDEGPIYQSTRMPHYAAALDRLLKSGDAYPCVCSRREVEMSASAPHAEDGAAVYPGTCRGKFSSIENAQAHSDRPPAIRFRVPADVVRVHDGFAGVLEFDPPKDFGDFVIAKGDGTPAYQLAVVVDDAEMGVTDVVRGDDLLSSAPRQILLYRALGLAEKMPQYYHLPLVVGPDGRRLAKRHGDTRLSYYRDKGVSRDRVLSLLGRWLGITGLGDSVPSSSDIIQSFDPARIPRQPVIFTSDDDAWLRKDAG